MPNELTADAILHGICAVAYLGLAVLILVQDRLSRTGVFLSVACLVTTGWAATVAFGSGLSSYIVVDALSLFRALAWYGFVLHLYRRSIPAGNMLSRTFGTMGLVGLLMVGLLALLAFGAPTQSSTLWSVGIVARLGIGVCAVLLIENLWRNTPPDARWHINLACIALGGLFVYDIVLSADTVLTRRVSPILLEGRPLVAILVVPLLAVSAARNRAWRIDIHLSRAVAFHSATLIASGVFFLSLAAAGEVFRALGATWGGVAEIGLIFTGVLIVAVFVTSGSARSWLRTIFVDHFFSHRYDYRREWIRCISTLSAPDTYIPLHMRAIRAAAEIVDSPGGTLFVRASPDRAFEWAGSWNMPALTRPIMPDHPILPLFCGGQAVVELSNAAPGMGLPDLAEDAWLAVPLGEGDRMIGFVLLAHPRAEFRLDREVFDLLRTVGGMIASFIAEQKTTEALTQTRQLHEYGKRFAFVAHDIKNVSSQLSLLLANAEVHMQNPDFQRDMLGTVRASVQKIGTLLRRLQEPEHDPADPLISPTERLADIAAACQRARGLRVNVEDDGRGGNVAMSATSFDAVITHLLDNATEASGPADPVRIRSRRELRRMVIDIIDRGPGMTPEFVRDVLFRPFGTARQGGTGIGAFQARELVRQAGGDLLVMSEPGVGTTMRLLLPVIDTANGQVTPLSA